MDPLIFKPLTAAEAQALHVELARASVDRALLARALAMLLEQPEAGRSTAREILARVHSRLTKE